MANVVEEIKKIQKKFKVLKFNREEATRVPEKNLTKALERYIRGFNQQIDDVHALIMAVQELKIEADEDPVEIREWSQKTKDELAEYESFLEELEAHKAELQREGEQRIIREEEKQREEARKSEFNEALKLEQAKLEMKKKVEREIAELHEKSKREQQSRVKLPKLVISKFQGTHIDWQRFWSQFETEIDKSDIPQVTKFSYLKEAVVVKVRSTIDGLPLTTEGYERAKQILKTRYGKPSEVANAHIQNIISLPIVHGTHPGKILDFFEKLVTSIQTLETMGKLKVMDGYARTTLDKLPGIRADLVRTDDGWQEWGFTQLVEALRKWCERNPVHSDERSKHQGNQRRDKVFQTDDKMGKPRGCVYCHEPGHKSAECDKVKSLTERKRLLSERKLCFNCTGGKHRAAECRSKIRCQRCTGKHHTSICDQEQQQFLIAREQYHATEPVTYPVVVVSVNGVKCRALLDTGAGSSYASKTLLDRIKLKPIRKERRRIDMMMQSVTQKIEVYDVNIASIDDKFSLQAFVSKVEKDVLLSLPNPKYDGIISRFNHLKGITMDDKDKKTSLPIHLILGNSEYSKIKTGEKPRIGKSGEPVGELTSFGWTIMSPGNVSQLDNTYFTRNSSADYEQLCNLDVLGLGANPESEYQPVHEDFKEQLIRSPDGWYETGLLWKSNHDALHNNKNGSIARLSSLVRRLQHKPELLEEYDNIIQDQLKQGIIEKTTQEPGEKEFYIPHKPVVREAAESTKVRIVFDASAKGTEKSPSLNDCLEPGPTLQNLLWNVLVRNRLKAVAICGDLKQAFLQVRIKEEDRDVLRFHWIKDKDPNKIEILRFTRALFGLVQSPFLLAATIEEHLKRYEDSYPIEIAEIRQSLYVDDVISGGSTIEEAKHLKETAKSVFQEARFELHKWHSNVPELESEMLEPDEQTYAKKQLGVKATETKILGLHWQKSEDSLAVTFPKRPTRQTKREILRYLASIYDPLGFAAPIHLLGKLVYRECCEQNVNWDQEVTDTVLRKWEKFQRSLPEKISVPRSLCTHQEPITSIELHVFGDTSAKGTAAVVYAVVYQESGVTQGLLAAKARLAKKNTSIPRLELVSAHMAANLVNNVKNALQEHPIEGVYGWLDSTVALHWINGEGSYKQFVANRVRLIREKKFINWRHVRTNDNAADIGSRGETSEHSMIQWLNGPSWLSEKSHWPDEISIASSEESEKEAKLTKDVLAVSVIEENQLDTLLDKFSFWKAIRVTAFIFRFLKNCKSKRIDRRKETLITAETEKAIKYWVIKTQKMFENTEKFNEDQERLNLVKDSEDIYRCHGRIQGEKPIYLPSSAKFTEELVKDAHIQSLHGGVGLTMARVRYKYWVPRLRQLAKRLIKSCNGCRRFHSKPYATPPPGKLPQDRTEGHRPFQVIGIDYAGPILYKRSKIDCKAYILLYACSLTRAIHLELLPNQTAEEFLLSLKRFIARRGRPEKIYSDNGRTFVAGAKWMKKVMRDEAIQNMLARREIKWQFNLSRAPWWGGQFERMVGLVKQALYKVTGRAVLTWKELTEVVLDIEIALNNRPLSYMEDDIQLPTLTPNVLVYGESHTIPEQDVDGIEDKDLRRRARYLKRCKDMLWNRWTGEYIKALRERHNMKHKTKNQQITEGEVVIIKNEERNRGRWDLGIIVKLITGRDGVVRAAKLRAGKSFLERPVQHLYPLELSCDMQDGSTLALNPDAKEFRSRRRAAQVAEEAIKIITEEEAN